MCVSCICDLCVCGCVYQYVCVCLYIYIYIYVPCAKSGGDTCCESQSMDREDRESDMPNEDGIAVLRGNQGRPLGTECEQKQGHE